MSENISHCCFYCIRDLRRIRPYIFLLFAIIIATPPVISRLDYSNSLLYYIASKDIDKDQCVQNWLAVFVTRSPRLSHSMPLLKSLHWHPVQFCIIFKLYAIAYQTLSSGESSYLFSMLSLLPESGGLRSSGVHLFLVPRVKTYADSRTFLLLSLLFGINSLNMVSHQITKN